MSHRIRAVVAVAALGTAALVAMPGAATAAPEGPRAPEITELNVSANPVVVTGKDTVTVTFTVTVAGMDGPEETVPQSVAAYLRPAGLGVEHRLTLDRSEQAEWTGSYEFDRRSPAGTWTLRAEAVRDGLKDEESLDFPVRQVWETKIAAFDAGPEPAERGGALTVRGRLLINGVDGWRPYRGRDVAIAFSRTGDRRTAETVTTARSDLDGWFQATVPARRRGYWWAVFSGVPGEAHPSAGGGDLVDVGPAVRRTRIVGFDAGPEPVDQGGALTVHGTLQVRSAAGWSGHRGQRVAILFKSDRAATWRRVAIARTDDAGRFRHRLTARESGWWRVEYAGGPRAAEADSRADWVPVRGLEPSGVARTRVVRFNAYPEPVPPGEFVRFRGAVQIWDGSGWAGYGRQKAALYFRPLGGSWGYVKTVWTNSKGRFWTKTMSRGSGDWRILFAGNDEAAPSVSRIDRVRAGE